MVALLVLKSALSIRARVLVSFGEMVNRVSRMGVRWL